MLAQTFKKPHRAVLEQVSGTTVFIRNKRTKSKSSLSPLAQRVVTQLSVMSASRKQPKLLKLAREDLIKHQTIEKCWSIYQQQQRERRNLQLELQYKSIERSMNLLQELSPRLFEAANASEKGKRFPKEMKVPTDFPPNTLWHYNFRK
ncbi:BBT_HP_G0144920.mRNA.1.CDS.1 [Saccharomyces cerevisiae]|nr:BBT_HP_G0134190.mRNA.1.CDS.1 [Saccharomyces cerevisiae]CAI5144921.1 BBT_HP_G0144920.mRNA.1.CDS.1 [Saccharomyces cerevisiae]CAI6977947.1 BBT_HP_G0134190.mRNA.1.CDS.1 [Saccharomyces cerevisiae]CAI6988572.1 BBT_HP_G0144920.mRNA.1.CDS.1 [Saccharomyces cerevisiae]